MCFLPIPVRGKIVLTEEVEVVCQDCGHKYMCLVSGDKFEIYRCDDCDRLLRAEKEAGMPQVLKDPCGCGGNYRRNLVARCPECRSRNLSVIRVIRTEPGE